MGEKRRCINKMLWKEIVQLEKKYVKSESRSCSTDIDPWEEKSEISDKMMEQF
jgi:hypothetical protein